MSKSKAPTVLAFERNLDISDAIFMQKDSNKPNMPATPVVITEKSVRGTISNRLKNPIGKDPTKLDPDIINANLQRVDVATLDHDKDTLVVTWSCKVLPFTGQPCVCNNQAYQQKMLSTIQSYIQQQGFAELAKRYASNIINGRWLWRNRLGAESIKITISDKPDDSSTSIIINQAKDYDLNHFEQQDTAIKQLADIIEKGLKGECFTIFYITAELNMGYGQEVFPSQELILDTGKKSKVLYQINGYAAMHSQKVGNAIRTIDTWYQDNAAFPIAIEPYGSVTTMGAAFRQPRQKQDFYTLFDSWLLNDEALLIEQQHYVIAILIRGGVFGASGKE